MSAPHTTAYDGRACANCTRHWSLQKEQRDERRLCCCCRWLLTGAEGAALLDAGRDGASHRLGGDRSRRDDGCATRGGGQTGHHRDGG